jgi:hypothetical protein
VATAAGVLAELGQDDTALGCCAQLLGRQTVLRDMVPRAEE